MQSNYPERERLIREELDRVLDAQRAMEPDIGPRRLRADERVPSYRVGDIIVSENLGEGVVTDDGMIDYDGIRISSATPVIGVHIDEVGRDITDAILDDEPPPTTFDELLALGLVDEDDDLARLETMLPQAQVAERVTARDEAVGLFLSQRGLSPTQAQDLLFEDGAPELMEELREFVSQRTQQTLPSENEIFYRIESARMADIPEGQVMDAILLDEFGDRLPDDDADVPDGPAQAYDALFPPDDDADVPLTATQVLDDGAEQRGRHSGLPSSPFLRDLEGLSSTPQRSCWQSTDTAEPAITPGKQKTNDGS